MWNLVNNFIRLRVTGTVNYCSYYLLVLGLLYRIYIITRYFHELNVQIVEFVQIV